MANDMPSSPRRFPPPWSVEERSLRRIGALVALTGRGRLRKHPPNKADLL